MRFLNKNTYKYTGVRLTNKNYILNVIFSVLLNLSYFVECYNLKVSLGPGCLEYYTQRKEIRRKPGNEKKR